MRALFERLRAVEAIRPVKLRCLPADLRQLTRSAAGRAIDEVARAGGYHLILLGSVLAELPTEEHEPLASTLLRALSADGSLLILEPALRETSRALHSLRDRLLRRGSIQVVAPCTTDRPCPALERPTDWCHELRSWQPPSRLRQLAAATGLRRRDLKWAYLTLGRPRSVDGDEPRTASAGASPLYRVVSSVIRSKGKRELFLCGPDGRSRAVRLDRNASEANAPFAGLGRGMQVRFDHQRRQGDRVLVLPDTQVHAEDPTLDL